MRRHQLRHVEMLRYADGWELKKRSGARSLGPRRHKRNRKIVAFGLSKPTTYANFETSSLRRLSSEPSPFRCHQTRKPLSRSRKGRNLMVRSIVGDLQQT